MKSRLVVLSLLLMAVNVLCAPSNVAVIPFVGDKNVTPEQLNFLTGKFSSELMRTKAFKVLDRGKMDYILKEQGFQQSGACNTSECQVQMGQLLGVDAIVGGNLVRFGSKYAFRADLIEVGTGQVLYSAEVEESGDLENVYASLCKKAAEELANNASPPVQQVSAPVESAPPVMSSSPQGRGSPSVQPNSVPPDAIPTAPSHPFSTKRKIALALWGTSLVGAGFGVYTNTQVSSYKKDYNSAMDASDYNATKSAYTKGSSAETRRTVGYGVSVGTLLLGAVLWFLPEGK